MGPGLSPREDQIDNKDLHAVVDGIMAAKFGAEASTVTAAIEIGGMTPATMRSLMPVFLRR